LGKENTKQQSKRARDRESLDRERHKGKQRGRVGDAFKETEGKRHQKEKAKNARKDT